MTRGVRSRTTFDMLSDKTLNTQEYESNQLNCNQNHLLHNLSSPPIAVRALGMNENDSQMLDENMALIESPLIAPSNSHFRQHYKTALYPYNITSHATQASGGGIYSTNDQDLNGNGESDHGHFNSVEKQSRYQLTPLIDRQFLCVGLRLMLY